MRARIAQVVLGDDRACVRLGGITLKPHQQSAVDRAEAAFKEFGGALICDEVGMGKTFVATAITRRFSHILVVAPAALASMWRGALETTETRADFVTFERLSRADVPLPSRDDYDLVIIDEAHHVRNPATRRYHSVARLARDARVLLLTATPIHNRAADMSALLALFLGSRACTLTARELARCVVRREHRALPDDVAIPLILPAQHRQISDNPLIVQELMHLPPPVPVRDGGLAGPLVGRGLVHQWASSEAALREAIRRRIAKAAALTASLESGNYPTAGELETWVYEKGALQLGFPELLSSPAEDARVLLDSVLSHSGALKEFHARHREEAALDAERADVLMDIRKAHPDAKIVAFAQYADTVSILFSRLSLAGGIAMMTARGGLVAGGKLTRDEVLDRFAPQASQAVQPSRAERIDLLLTTDILSEGVNLQDAEVVVHLDVPWTAARMEQRVGRSARMGSGHSRVHVYLIRPPASAAAVLGIEPLVQRKWRAAVRAIGSKGNGPFADDGDDGEQTSTIESVPAKTERLRDILGNWRDPHPVSDGFGVSVASVTASCSGFVAAVSISDKPSLLCSIPGCLAADLDSQIAAALLCEGQEVATEPKDYEVAVNQIHAWLEENLASEAAGVAGSRSRGRRRLLNRIDSVIQSAPPHLRGARSCPAARAREIATSQHGASIEAELELLGHSQLPDQDWLDAIAALQPKGTHRPEERSESPSLRLHAVMLLCQRHHAD